MKSLFFFEMTDTYGGEANYTWANHFKVTATTFTGAIRKVAAETGYSGRVRCVMDSGDMKRWDVDGAAVCFFGHEYDADHHSAEKYPRLKEL